MKTWFFLLLLGTPVAAHTQVLHLPPRETGSPGGRAIAASVSTLPRDAREEVMFQQFTAGNIPDFMRTLAPVTVSDTFGSASHTLVYYVIPDYLAIGSDEDYFLVPMTPLLAQRLADTTDCSLPTRKIVDDVYRAATVKLTPQPIPPSPEMITVPVFSQHNDSVWQQRSTMIGQGHLGALVGGDKKDVIISNDIYRNLKQRTPRPVVIYGWHRLNGIPIQPVYNGHQETYADYSHGIRLVQRKMLLDGSAVDMWALLADSSRCRLVSDEGLILTPRYGESAVNPERAR